ncbi:MAG: ABC transporter substrate-binding protein [Oscillospiraceae bacterium]|nr:ABC transporter substrate-binding protein [Clostridiales bacterium]MDD6937365.1 ABC transporter substrate-binding protein [Clostridiales bacterium]MDY2961480.1 ABC transporter substrate-binding protein [Oscillospiraceae bacterium]MDY5595743.1 ABC transporter substrate-binding protein [Oscillospiraceae bacterium]
MKRNRIRNLTALVLALVMIFALAACGQKQESEPTPTPAPAADASLPVNVMVLNGTTGFGMAGLISDSEAGNAALNYTFSVETDASNITAALVNGTADIGALPTNAAATLYNKTGGKVQVLALNTLGVLYLVTDGSEEITSFEDLRGKTVYAPAQNPTFIFQALCEKNGLAVGEDITIDNTYAQPADLNTAVSSGEVSLAVLPEPMVTVARSANDQLTVALDLTAEWDKVMPAGSLVQGCVVVRTEFAEEHPAEVAKFLEEYEASIELLTSDTAAAAQKIEETGVFAKAAVAQKAIPNCNVCFVTGAEMQSALGEFLNVMFEVAPDSIGGAVPADDFYCILK